MSAQGGFASCNAPKQRDAAKCLDGVDREDNHEVLSAVEAMANRHVRQMMAGPSKQNSRPILASKLGSLMAVESDTV